MLAVSAFVLFRLTGRALDPIIDTGRDLYISEQIRHGLKLYRDIRYNYPPLSPYLLAAITAMTGSSLAAYSAIGGAIAIVTAATVYAMSRIVAAPAAAGAAALLFAACSICSISDRASNYMLPYAYAATLAMLFPLAGTAFILMWAYVERRARWLAVGLAFFLAGSWTKQEGVIFAVLIPLIAAVVHRMPPRWLSAYAIAGIASFVAVDRYFSDAPDGRHWLFDNVLAPSLLRGSSARFFYRQVSGFDAIGGNLLAAAAGALVIGIVILALRYSDRWPIPAIAILVAVPLILGVAFFRGWAIAQLVLLPFAIRRPREPLLMLLALSLCGSSRVFLRLTPEWYGFVFIIPVYVLIGYTLFEWLPARGAYSMRAARLAIIPIIAVAVQFLWIENRVLSYKTFAVPTARGVFHDSDGGRATILNAFLSKLQSDRARSLVVVPEGLALNYLARVPTSISFHTFTPVETADPAIEAQIIQDIAAHPPQYIAVVTRVVSDFGYRGFGADYDQRLAGVIRDHYQPYARWREPSFELILLRAR
ncbi:MAG TPA: hypothetical protein VLV78_22785 [Thermoanaerobaculia bacterium]|nr:hypothetical protein [Thermoanaerobaculia bacterium]